MAVAIEEPLEVAPFRRWLLSNGALIHEALYFRMGVYGLSLYTKEKLPRDSQVVSCPFNLIITAKSCQKSLVELCIATDRSPEPFSSLGEREIICAYLVLHWILFGDSFNESNIDQDLTKYLRHGPYLATLPARDALKTPLHYSDEELELLRGTNVYSAAMDRRTAWKSEWAQLLIVASQVDQIWAQGITWERYLAAATFISSRAFPSSLMASKPSLNDPTAHPVLVPLVDALNHARAVSVSWVVSVQSGAQVGDEKGSALSLVLHNGAAENSELYNNYGAKPNSEFLLGYGFTLPSNPDDTMAFKLPGEGRRWEIGRKVTGDLSGLFEAVKERMKTQLGISAEDLEEMDEVEKVDLSLEATDLFQEMLQGLIMKLPTWIHEDNYQSGARIRPEILEIVRPYIEGQRDILGDLNDWSKIKRGDLVARAKYLGVEFEG